MKNTTCKLLKGFTVEDHLSLITELIFEAYGHVDEETLQTHINKSKFCQDCILNNLKEDVQ